MKSIALTITAVLFATLSFAQFPQSQSPDSCCYLADDLRAAVYMNQSDKVNVQVAKLLGDKVKIRVKDSNGVLYTKSYKAYERVDLAYDISQFPSGDYVFEIVQNKKVVLSQLFSLPEDNTQLASR